MLTKLIEGHRMRGVSRSLSRYPHLTSMERGLILSQKKYHRKLLRETRHFRGSLGFDFDTVKKYNTTGYCANNLSASIRLHVRESMHLYRLTSNPRYFVHRFHKDIITDYLRSDIISYYSTRRDMTLIQISTYLSQKHGIRVPTYQISRISRGALPSSLWRRKPTPCTT